jgi:hypothetical protein
MRPRAFSSERLPTTIRSNSPLRPAASRTLVPSSPGETIRSVPRLMRTRPRCRPPIPRAGPRRNDLLDDHRREAERDDPLHHLDANCRSFSKPASAWSNWVGDHTTRMRLVPRPEPPLDSDRAGVSHREQASETGNIVSRLRPDAADLRGARMLRNTASGQLYERAVKVLVEGSARLRAGLRTTPPTHPISGAARAPASMTSTAMSMSIG